LRSPLPPEYDDRRAQARLGWVFIALGLIAMAGVLLYEPLESAARNLLEWREREQAAQAEAPPEQPAAAPPMEAAAGREQTSRLEAPAEIEREPAPEPAAAPPASPPPRQAPAPARAIRQLPPSVPEGIRNRIVGEISVDIAVRIGPDGRVTSARPVAPKETDGLRSYLASRAIEAARQWRYNPARSGGRAVSGEEVIRFRFRRGETRWH
jgi:TonB family protein